MKAQEFGLSGVIDVGDTAITMEQFFDAFIEMIEARGWSYGGGITPLDEEGLPITVNVFEEGDGKDAK